MTDEESNVLNDLKNKLKSIENKFEDKIGIDLPWPVYAMIAFIAISEIVKWIV